MKHGKFTVQGVRYGLGYGSSRYQSVMDYFDGKSHTVSFNGKVSFEANGLIVVGLRGHIYQDRYDSRYGRYFPVQVGMSDYTDIVKLMPNGAMLVNNGGHETATSKKWINIFSNIGISQKNYQWYIGQDKVYQYALRTPNGLVFTDGVYRESHIFAIWDELQVNPDSAEWDLNVWHDFLQVERITLA